MVALESGRIDVKRNVRNWLLAASAAAMIAGLSMSAGAAQSAAQDQTAAKAAAIGMDHPLLAQWNGPNGGVPPWDQVRVADFLPAFEAAIAAAETEIAALAADPAKPNFANTIAALERQGRPLTRLSTMFYVFDSTMNDEAMQEASQIINPKLAGYYDRIAQNEALFKRVEAIYKSKGMKKLTASQKRLVEDYYKTFVRNGVGLDAQGKARLTEINQRLATLYTDFSQNQLKDEETYVTWINSKAQLKGLPGPVVAGLAAAAESKGRKGRWAVPNTRSAVEPFLTYSDDRRLREQVWRTFVNRGDNGGETDNNAIIKEILKLRAERATLLGYETHAHWRVEPQMAKTPEAAMALMESVWPKAVARVKEEVADMQQVADAEGAKIKIAPWDYRYYQEKVRKAKYDLDMNEVKPYLQLDKLRDGMMWAASELFGIEFRPIDNVPVYHPDVRAWEVADKSGGVRGMWYFDPYAREGKQSGAWMNEYRTQQKFDGAVLPIVSNNSNFVKTTDGKPILISWDDAETLFHEFGHALHGLLSNVDYPSQAGTNTATDFVEFPSQINEHWLSTPEVLNRFAVHYETGEPIPAALVEKIKATQTFNQGFATVEYLASALVDMKLHLAGGAEIDPGAFEKETLAALGMPDEIVMRHRMPQFGHIFSGDGYSAGYYSYLWSDSLTADAAEAFVEAGGFFDKATAARFEKCILSAGDTRDQAAEFRCFRGRDVDTAALMRKRGFPVGDAGAAQGGK
jgi:peptidyl-dipeptidase Dcp